MSKSKELIKNTAIIMLGKLCTQLIVFLMLPLYTNVLSSEQYGLYDLIVTYIALAIPIVGFQLEMGVFRFLIDCRKNESTKTKLITNTILAITLSAILFSGIFIAVANVISLNYYPYILFCALSMLISNLFLQIARGLGDNLGYSIGSIIAGVSAVILNLVFLLVCKMGIEGILLATAISNTICALFLIIKEKVIRHIDVKTYDKKQVAVLLKYSLPLIPNSLIWWVIGVSDRTIISIFMNPAANGIYAVSNKFSGIISQIYAIFNLSWTESAALHINDDDRDKFFSNTFNMTVKIVTSISLLMLAAMPFIFKVMVGEGFNEAYLYIPILTFGMIFNAIVSFMGAIYIAKKRTKEVAITSLWSGVLNIVINVALINQIGLWAASISTFLAFFIMTIYRYFDVQKYVKLKFDARVAVVLLLLFAVCITLYYFNNYIAAAANVAIVAIASIVMNRGAIKTAAKAIRGKLLG